MKEKGGFGKGGEKNFEGTLTKLQMQTYLIVKDFRPRLNKRGEEPSLLIESTYFSPVPWKSISGGSFSSSSTSTGMECP